MLIELFRISFGFYNVLFFANQFALDNMISLNGFQDSKAVYKKYSCHHACI